MKKAYRAGQVVVVLVVLSLLPARLAAQFKKLETNDLRLIYFPAESFLASHTISSFVSAFRLHQKLFDYQPSEKVNILLHDFGDVSNAAAGAVPQNTIIAGIAPSSYVFETMTANERINGIMQHELVHILTSDKAARSDRFFRRLFFGKVTPDEANPLTMVYGYLTTPRLYVPRWFMEGIAVFMETWLSGGYGRLLGCYDEMVFRTLVMEKARIYDLVGLESAGTRLDFQVGVNSYLYGTRFFGYLGLHYGPESLIRWVSRERRQPRLLLRPVQEGVRPDPRPGLAGMDRMGKDVPGGEPGDPSAPARSLPAATSPAGRWDRCRRPFMTGGEKRCSWASTTRARWPTWRRSTQRPESLRKLCDVKGPALYSVCSLAYDDEQGILFYTTDNNAWRDLRRLEVDSGRTRLLIKDGRIGDLAFNRSDRSLWGIRHYNGISTIVRIAPPYREWKQVYSWPYGKDMYDIAISPDGRLMTGALTEISGRQSLIKIDLEKLLNGEAAYKTISDFESSSPANFVFSLDGRSLYGSSYYSGVANIYRCDLGRQPDRDPDQRRDRPLPPGPARRRYAAGFPLHRQGFQPAIIPSRREDAAPVRAIAMLGQQISKQHPQVRDWVAESPGRIDPQPLIVSSGTYSPLKQIGLKSLFPVVEGYKDSAAYRPALPSGR